MAPKPERHIVARLFAKRAAALKECSRLAARYSINDWGNTESNTESICIGPAWPDMAKKE
jgi:hypothetical protein